MPRPLPQLAQIKPDTPLRLYVAAAVAYPDGSMTASGLRKEAGRGRLVIERVAGKDYTTLANIQQMREVCRVKPRDHGYSSAEVGPATGTPIGSFSTPSTAGTKKALAAALTIVEGLSGRSPPTLPASTSRRQRKPTNVIPLTSLSPTSSRSTPATKPRARRALRNAPRE